MECRDLRETISAYVDGEASSGEAASVREHLASCERCRVLERQMRAVGAGVGQLREPVPERFREDLFARLESEGDLRPRKMVFLAAWRWFAVPLAVAAGLGLFLLTSREADRGPAPPVPSTARVEATAPVPPALSSEDREMLALLDILEDPASFDPAGDMEGMEMFAPGDPANSSSPPRGGKKDT